MIHHFGLSCMCREETLEDQIGRISEAEEYLMNAIQRIADYKRSSSNHHCDGYVYEAILAPMVDMIASKEKCVQNITGFVRVMDANAIGSATMDLDCPEWASYLGRYIFSWHLFPDSNSDEELDVEDEEKKRRRAEKKRRSNFIDKWVKICMWE